MSNATLLRWRYRSHTLLSAVLYYLALALFTIIVLVPFYWMARASVSNQEQILMSPPLYFPTPTLENFGIVAEQVPLVLFITNSIIYATFSAVIAVVTSFLAAYAFSRIKAPGSEFLQWLLIITVAIPQVALIIPLYQILKTLQLLNTLAGLILVLSSLLTPFTIWVLMSFIKQVPQEIEEAATIDGATLLQILWRIVLPVTTPGLVTMLVINFINGWNDLLHPLSFSSTEAAKTLSVAITYIYSYRASWGLPWNLVSTVGMIMVIPIIIMVIFAQRAIVSGLTRGAIK
ncbi:MAG: carbohydrate ABC transporter permease [Caldilinea sp. CFX5]|nr:carbohydrate ABC transporter permease [Caldilinea sp. CFX5]